MTKRVLVTALVLLLTAAFTVYADDRLDGLTVPMEPAPAMAEQLFTPAPPEGPCEAEVLADVFSFPITEMAYTNTCGQCSWNPCKGVSRGTWCGFINGEPTWCIPPLTTFCSGTQDWDCRCANHYY